MCRKYFWTNFLYLNNYVHWKHECYGVSWYLATDTQMFVFAPILIIALALNKFVGLVVAGGILVASTAVNMITVYKNHYPATALMFGWFDPKMKHMELIRLSPSAMVLLPLALGKVLSPCNDLTIAYPEWFMVELILLRPRKSHDANLTNVEIKQPFEGWETKNGDLLPTSSIRM
uniref:Uncharacterized protein n=1 Tax=Acrobeloides nanus TaxID=290746 RepID=A0A914C1F9_9BILA